MLVYSALDSDDINVKLETNELTHHMIKKMKKVISPRRAALDFDTGFLNKIATTVGYDFVAEVKSERKSLIKMESTSGAVGRR